MSKNLEKIMARFFKKEERPMSFTSVKMRKAPRNYIKWFVVFITIVLNLINFFWKS